MKHITKSTLIIACLALISCDNAKDSRINTKLETPVEDGSKRFRIQRVAGFQDNFAYNNRRGIYIIEDKQTGQQYVGVSGIGISELGSHQVQQGKHVTTQRDER